MLSDSALVTLGTVLVVMPGLVTTAAGLLLLVPATRAVAGPSLTTVLLRGLGVRAPFTVSSGADSGRRGYAGDGRDFIDGEVIDVRHVERTSGTRNRRPCRAGSRSQLARSFAV